MIDLNKCKEDDLLTLADGSIARYLYRIDDRHIGTRMDTRKTNLAWDRQGLSTVSMSRDVVLTWKMDQQHDAKE